MLKDKNSKRQKYQKTKILKDKEKAKESLTFFQ